MSDVPTAVTTRPADRGGELPVTGSDMLPIGIGGLVLLAMGVALRRRSQAST